MPTDYSPLADKTIEGGTVQPTNPHHVSQPLLVPPRPEKRTWLILACCSLLSSILCIVCSVYSTNTSVECEWIGPAVDALYMGIGLTYNQCMSLVAGKCDSWSPYDKCISVPNTCALVYTFTSGQQTVCGLIVADPLSYLQRETVVRMNWLVLIFAVLGGLICLLSILALVRWCLCRREAGSINEPIV